MKKPLLKSLLGAVLLTITIISCKKDDVQNPDENPEEKPSYNMLGRWDFYEGGYYNTVTNELEYPENVSDWVDVIFREDGTVTHETDCCGDFNWKDSAYPNKVLMYDWYFDVKYQKDGFTFLLADTTLTPDAVYDGYVFGYLLQNYDSIPK